MIAIWPAGPPKLMKPSLSQNRVASPRRGRGRRSTGGDRVPLRGSITASSAARLGLDAEGAQRERQHVGALVDLLAGRLARAVAGLGLDADQHRRRAGLRRLQRRGELEAVRRHHAIVVVAGRHQRRRILRPGLRFCSGEYSISVSKPSFVSLLP